MKPNTDPPSCIGPKNRFRDAPRNQDFTIDQDWASYSAAEHDRWNRLFGRSLAALQNRACGEFLAMMEALSLSDGGIPDMEKLSDRLENITGWRVVPVAGLVPDEVFFNHLANRRFYSTRIKARGQRQSRPASQLPSGPHRTCAAREPSRPPTGYGPR